MRHLITRYLSFLKVGMVGAVGALLQTGLLVLFVEVSHLHPVVANALAGEVAIISNFVLNNLWTFKGNSIHALPKRFALFNASALGSIVMQAIVVWVGVTLFGPSLYLLYAIIGIGAGWVVNYFLYTKFVWRNPAAAFDHSVVYYVANIRMPTEKAHGVQIMKTCEAFAQAGARVVLVVPNRKTNITEDPFAYYGAQRVFAIRRIPTLDLVWLGRAGFWLESASFAVSSVLYSLLRGRGLYYSRDEFPLWMLSFFNAHTVWESHTGRFNFLTRRLLGAGKKCVVISHGLKDFYLKRGVQSSILVAPDAIDLSAFQNPESQEESRKRLGLPLDKKLALYIGRLDGWKGVETLFEASKLLPHDIQVAVIGGEKAEIEKLSQLYLHVTFLGARPYTELPDNQAAADVLVLPNTGKDIVSVQFTSPMKLFSYMAAGKPIVASDLPSIREVLDEKNAVFFAPDDPSALAGAMQKVFSDYASAMRLAQHAKESVANYSWENRAKSIITFLQ
jgi:glycosyltransferase involved in cell wall biosynthesis